MEEHTIDTIDNLSAALEAILFACGTPIRTQRIAEALGVPLIQLEGELCRLAEDYAARNSGIVLQKLGDAWQMCTSPAYAAPIQQVMETQKKIPLSAAAMEVLTIVAYNQPVSKSFVEHVRGVDSGSVVNSLVEKELLMECGRLEVPGHPIAYGTTPHFLRCFGLSSLEDLPPIPALQMDAAESAQTPEEQLETAEERQAEPVALA